MTPQPGTRPSRNVIVNADDFGMSRQINEAILQAFETGLISSATLIANMPAFEEACQLVRQGHLQRNIGLHLNFTEGKPLTADIVDCPRFVTRWFAGVPVQVLRLTGNEVLALEAEIVAQMALCERQGITPTHLDSHHHMHTEWGIAPVVIRAANVTASAPSALPGIVVRAGGAPRQRIGFGQRLSGRAQYLSTVSWARQD